MMADIWWSLPLTLVVSFATRKLTAWYKSPLFNPLLVVMAVAIPLPMLTGTPYDSYFKGSEVLNDLLQPMVVTLTYLSYEQLYQIRARWKLIITICLIDSMVAMVTETFAVLLTDTSPEIVALIPPKLVTIPVVMMVGGNVDGIPAISAVCVIFVDIPGTIFSRTLFNAMHTHTRATCGLTMGTTPYALDMTRCVELDCQEGVFNSLALVLYGVITSLIVSSLFPIILAIMG